MLFASFVSDELKGVSLLLLPCFAVRVAEVSPPMMMKEKFVKKPRRRSCQDVDIARFACDWVDSKACLIKTLWIFLFLCWPGVEYTLSNLTLGTLFVKVFCELNILYPCSSTANRGWPNLMQRDSKEKR